MRIPFTFLALLAHCANGVPLEPTATNRISDGSIAMELQFPYMISLQQLGVPQQLETRGHRCGGVLITLQHALTSASCLLDNLDGNSILISANEYRVFAGSSHLTNDAILERVRSIANFTLHPEFIGRPAYLNDIAIITLTSPFNISFVTPLTLPSDDYDPADFTQCTVSGWGASNGTMTASPMLRYANKYIYNHNLCTNIYNPMTGSLNIMNSMICSATYDILAVSCIGDDGNPLVCNNTLTGILMTNAGCTVTSHPEVYTRVSNYNTWIRSVTGAANSFTPGIFVLILFSIFNFLFTL